MNLTKRTTKRTKQTGTTTGTKQTTEPTTNRRMYTEGTFLRSVSVSTFLMLSTVFTVMGLVLAQSAAAGPISCLDPETCGWSVSVDGSVVMSGSYQIAENGDLSLPNAINVVGADYSIDITNIGGNVDPEIVFGVGATNTSGGFKSFAFAFNVPLLGLSGLVDTEAALATTLTAPSTGPGLNLVPTSGTGFIVDSQDIRFSPFSSVDKGVDIGGPLFDPAGGLATVTNELVQSQINLVGPYDVMTVIVAFALDSNGGVGLSGRVTQTPVPEPGTAMLLGLGLAVLATRRARRS